MTRARSRFVALKRRSRHSEHTSTPGTPAAGVPAWSPFRHRLFAAMWGAQFVPDIGGWMQTAAAQWLMLTLAGTIGDLRPGMSTCAGTNA